MTIARLRAALRPPSLIRAFVRFACMLPKALDRLHLQWALAELTSWNPMHPDLPLIVRRLNELEKKS